VVKVSEETESVMVYRSTRTHVVNASAGVDACEIVDNVRTVCPAKLLSSCMLR
jgi:hypothetical protein